jgi:hypothetical protein
VAFDDPLDAKPLTVVESVDRRERCFAGGGISDCPGDRMLRRTFERPDDAQRFGAILTASGDEIRR